MTFFFIRGDAIAVDDSGSRQTLWASGIADSDETETEAKIVHKVVDDLVGKAIEEGLTIIKMELSRAYGAGGQLESDDYFGFPSMDIIYEHSGVANQRATIAPYSYTFGKLPICGATGTIVAHTPILIGIETGIGTWYFKPDDGPGIIIPVHPFDVLFLSEDEDETR